MSPAQTELLLRLIGAERRHHRRVELGERPDGDWRGVDAAEFEHVVVGPQGLMAPMRTVTPGSFVEFKCWLAARADRPPLARLQDARQAAVVQALISEGRLPKS